MKSITENPLSGLFQELELLGSETFEVSDYTDVDIHLANAAGSTSCSLSTSCTGTSCSTGNSHCND